MSMSWWIDYDFGCGPTRRWGETLEQFVADLGEMRAQGLPILACGYHCEPPALGAMAPASFPLGDEVVAQLRHALHLGQISGGTYIKTIVDRLPVSLPEE